MNRYAYTSDPRRRRPPMFLEPIIGSRVKFKISYTPLSAIGTIVGEHQELPEEKELERWIVKWDGLHGVETPEFKYNIELYYE